MMSLDILQPEFFRIGKKIEETEDAFSIDIQSAEGKEISFLPGQFNMLYAFGVGEAPISISGDPRNRDSQTHTIKAVGHVTKALSRLKEGDLVGVRGPFGTAWPIDKFKNKDLVLIAGGIGLAPLRPLIYTLLNNRNQFGKITLLYGARDPGDLLFIEELKRWNEALENQVYFTVDFAEASWQGNVGVVTNLIPRISSDLSDSLALVCGPEIMMRFSIRELIDRGVKPENIYLSMERNMKCAIGQCGRCQFVSNFLCKDGPIFSFEKVQPFFWMKEV